MRNIPDMTSSRAITNNMNSKLSTVINKLWYILNEKLKFSSFSGLKTLLQNTYYFLELLF
jgi:hypothetical protein